jgi:trk system potassium uptake protein TrkH
LPLLGVGGVQLARAESPGPHPDRLTPRFRETAKRLWLAYLVITAVETVLLTFGDMSLFQAVNHSLTTMSTGGFGTEATSLGGFSNYTQWIVIGFMIIAGTSFTLHIRALRKPQVYPENPEWRLYLGILVLAAGLMVGGIWAGGVADAFRDGIFTAVSLVTTTGFVTADFGAWTGGLQVLAVGLMFVGGMAGSTAGSVKVYRLGVLTKASRADLRRLIHPRGIFVTKWGKEQVPESIVESIQSFFLLYMFLFMTGTLIFAIIVSGTGANFDLPSSASAVASALGNIGPGLGEVGPASNFLGVPVLGKWLLAFLMIVGRLEIYPVLLLFTRELWRK